MPRYKIIAMRNYANGRWEDKHSYDLAESMGLEIYTSNWEDLYTDAHGKYFAVRTRHLKRLPRAIRKQITTTHNGA